MREVPLTQETDCRDNEILHAETLERDFDKLTMRVRQSAEKSERAVTVDIFDDTAADSLISGIRKAVSDCQKAVETTTENARAATAAQKPAESARIFPLFISRGILYNHFINIQPRRDYHEQMHIHNPCGVVVFHAYRRCERRV